MEGSGKVVKTLLQQLDDPGEGNIDNNYCKIGGREIEQNISTNIEVSLKVYHYMCLKPLKMCDELPKAIL